MEILTTINSNKYYSIRQAAQFIPWINCEPTLQKMIQYDVNNNNNKLFKVKTIKRNIQKRYFLKGEDIINIVNRVETGELILENSTLREKNTV